ncbi:hypothetical protein HZA42_03365 [Candidatus Peregrinibacteria bacterium]|nr:hypothetical protein [Candidatus Peregrinibacteria bacterium]
MTAISVKKCLSDQGEIRPVETSTADSGTVVQETEPTKIEIVTPQEEPNTPPQEEDDDPPISPEDGCRLLSTADLSKPGAVSAILKRIQFPKTPAKNYDHLMLESLENPENPASQNQIEPEPDQAPDQTDGFGDLEAEDEYPTIPLSDETLEKLLPLCGFDPNRFFRDYVNPAIYDGDAELARMTRDFVVGLCDRLAGEKIETQLEERQKECIGKENDSPYQKCVDQARKGLKKTAECSFNFKLSADGGLPGREELDELLRCYNQLDYAAKPCEGLSDESPLLACQFKVMDENEQNHADVGVRFQACVNDRSRLFGVSIDRTYEAMADHDSDELKGLRAELLSGDAAALTSDGCEKYTNTLGLVTRPEETAARDYAGKTEFIPDDQDEDPIGESGPAKVFDTAELSRPLLERLGVGTFDEFKGTYVDAVVSALKAQGTEDAAACALEIRRAGISRSRWSGRSKSY